MISHCKSQDSFTCIRGYIHTHRYKPLDAAFHMNNDDRRPKHTASSMKKII